jgi:hypothetical protein
MTSASIGRRRSRRPDRPTSPERARGIGLCPLGRHQSDQKEGQNGDSRVEAQASWSSGHRASWPRRPGPVLPAQHNGGRHGDAVGARQDRAFQELLTAPSLEVARSAQNQRAVPPALAARGRVVPSGVPCPSSCVVCSRQAFTGQQPQRRLLHAVTYFSSPPGAWAGPTRVATCGRLRRSGGGRLRTSLGHWHSAGTPALAVLGDGATIPAWLHPDWLDKRGCAGG